MLRLVLVLRFLELLNCLLELEKSLIMVLLGLILLSFEEVKLTLPKSLLLIEFRLELSMLLFHVVVLGFPVLYLLSDSKFTLGKGLVELLVLLLKLLVLDLVSLDKILLLPL